MAYLPSSEHCFVRGERNQSGLRARLYVDEPFVRMHFKASGQHCSYPNTTHGGIVAAAMDECMAWAASHAIERMCVTAELTIRYLAKVPNDMELTVSAEVVRAHRRVVHAAGSIHDNDGKTFARAEGKFIPLSKEETLKIDDGLIYREGDLRVFQRLREEGQ